MSQPSTRRASQRSKTARGRPKAGQQLLRYRTHGGARPGSGRKRGPGRPNTPHRARPRHRKHEPVHVTLRALPMFKNLRSQLLFKAWVLAFRAANQVHAGAFAVVHFSVQRDHLHLIVEARDAAALSRGRRGLAIRLARATNRVMGRRGPVWGDRWHGHALTTPSEVRNALRYVLLNHKKHGVVSRASDEPSGRAIEARFDPRSTAPWLVLIGRGVYASGWAGSAPTPWSEQWPAAPPRTWLLRLGWKKAGLLDVNEAPAS